MLDVMVPGKPYENIKILLFLFSFFNPYFGNDHYENKVGPNDSEMQE